MTGRIGRDEARNLMLEYARANNRDDGTRAITNLASSARLNLIIDQNASMARAVGDYERMYSSVNKKLFPYVIYHASVGSRTPRSEHQRYDGMIFEKDDPWLKTHWPPWDFNCHCRLENCTDKKAHKTPDLIQPPTPAEKVTVDTKSGYSFDPAHAFEKFDYSAIKDPDLQDKAKSGVEKILSEPGPAPAPVQEPKEKEPEKTEDQTGQDNRKEYKTTGLYSDSDPQHKADKLDNDLQKNISEFEITKLSDDAPGKIRSVTVKELTEGTPSETDQKGNISISRETAWHLNSAIQKAKTGNHDYNHDELIAIESVTHEVNHLRQSLFSAEGFEKRFINLAQEVANEELTRQLFPKQAAALGFKIDKEGIEFIQKFGRGYSKEVSRLRNIADSLGCLQKYQDFVCNELVKSPGRDKLGNIMNFFLEEMKQQGIPKDPLLSVNDFFQNERGLLLWIKQNRR